ncbi:DUF3558 family protein [Saccharothrix sp. AJ9571]|nr:DUF3558 family protein [Saccharothrix sp. AJ9571]
MAGLAALLAMTGACAGTDSSSPDATGSAASSTLVSAEPDPGAGTMVTRKPWEISAFIAEPCRSLPPAQKIAIVASTGETLSETEISRCIWAFGADQNAKLNSALSHGTVGNIDILAQQDPAPEWDTGRPDERNIGTLRALFPDLKSNASSPNCNAHVQLTPNVAVSVAVTDFRASNSCQMVDTLAAAVIAYINPPR